VKFFRQTIMGLKIRFTRTCAHQYLLNQPAGWSKLALPKLDFYVPPARSVSASTSRVFTNGNYFAITTRHMQSVMRLPAGRDASVRAIPGVSGPK